MNYLNKEVFQESNDVLDVIVSCFHRILFEYKNIANVPKTELCNMDEVISLCEQTIPKPISWKQFYKREFYDRIRFPLGLKLDSVFEIYLTDENRNFYGLLQEVVSILDSQQCHSLVNRKVIQPQDVITFVGDLLGAILRLYKVFNQEAIKGVKAWLQELGGLTDFEVVGIRNTFTLFVSMGFEKFYTHFSSVISTSLITETHTHTFQPDSRFVGWCFRPKPEQIYGADESDSNVFLEYCDSLEKCIVRLLQNALFLEQMKQLRSYYDVAYRVTSVEKMLSSDVCNEVFLDGDTKPAAVFCRITNNPEAERYCRLAREVGKEQRKPVVFLDERGEQPKITIEHLG